MRSRLVTGSDAVIEGNYRYFLSRKVGDQSLTITFVGLNPSTADAVKDDPTIRRCMGFARSWEAGTVYMVNLFAYRTSSPKVLRASIDPIGPANEEWLDFATKNSRIVVAAWGNSGEFLNRGRDFSRKHVGRLKCLGLTNMSMPRHPLYVRADTTLCDFELI
jgi:hypothetical protein